MYIVYILKQRNDKMTKQQLIETIAKLIKTIGRDDSITNKVQAIKTSAHELAKALGVSNEEGEAMFYHVAKEVQSSKGWA